MAMKTVCISTHCDWTSYGSVMQAIGLKKTLLGLGYESFIVRDRPAPAPEKSFAFQWRRNPRMLAKEFLSIPYRRERERMYRESNSFIRRTTDIKYFDSYNTLKENIPQADFYLAGSDAIWHPDICREVFFLDFVPEGIKRLSYGASMKKTNIPEKNKEKFASLVSKMDAISVREQEAADVIEQFTQKAIAVHIDPSFLLTSEEWREFSKEYPIERPYILVYTIFWDRTYNKQLKRLKRQTGYEIVAICPGGISSVWADRKIFDADPGQFLYLIDHAEAVVSSSFHGIALALNFHKKTAAVIDPASPSRIRNLLSLLAVRNRDIADVMNFDLSGYVDINRRISEERERSVEYLREVLAE